ncbi:MAG: PH domain-containing protein [Thermoleophilaceae bacterium]
MDVAQGETVVFRGHPSLRSVLGFYVAGLAVAALLGALAAGVSYLAEDEIKAGWVALPVVAVLAVLAVYGVLKRLATEYVITDRRLHIRRGLLSRKTEETKIGRIQNVNTSQSLLERLMRVGTVDFDVASDERQDLFRFTGVANPREVVEALDRATEAAAGGRSGP